MLYQRTRQVLATLLLLAATSQGPFAEGKPKDSSGKTDTTHLDYPKAMKLATLFYDAQRSGRLPANNRIPWRGDSALGDGQDHGLDLTGGWYDAGDHVKFNFPMAWSATTLIWGVLEFGDAWSKSGEMANILDTVKWPLDYLLKCHPDENTYYVQVGDGGADHQFWGAAESMNMNRPSFAVTPQNPGTEFAAEGAAALAAGSILFKDDKAYSDLLKAKAKSLFELANKYRGSSDISAPYYKSYSGYWDELGWASTWLYKATKEQKYLNMAENDYYDACCAVTNKTEFSWDRKSSAVQLMLFELTKKEKYSDGFAGFMDSFMYHTPRTPKGLVYFDKWAPNRYSANTAFLALVAAKHGLETKTYIDFAQSQIDYILKAGGDVNPETNQPFYSYQIGFGDKYPRAPHHRGASCGNGWCGCSSSPQPNILYGAMVGGPGRNDDYSDDCGNYVTNEVATDYNAGFTSACAGLAQLVLKLKK